MNPFALKRDIKNHPRSNSSLCIPLTLLFLFILNSIPSNSQERKPQWLVSTSGYVWCGTEAGLYKFALEEETWYAIEKVKMPVKEIQLYAGNLWLGGRGVMTAGPELGDWLYFDRSTGLPGNNYNALIFSDDYYWIASDSGAARYDPILEEWEKIGDNRAIIKDLAMTKEYVFFAGESAIYRYDNKYENWLFLNSDAGISGDNYLWIEELPGEIWFIGENCIDIYLINSRSWISLLADKDYPFRKINQILPDGERLWILTDRGIFLCYWQGRDFQPFPRMDRLKNFALREISGGNGDYYFATDQGLMIYHENQEQWELVDKAMGLNEVNLQRVSSVGQLLFLRSEKKIQIYSLSEKRVLPALNIEALSSTSEKHILSWDERGLGGELKKGEVRLKGNYTYINQWGESSSFDRHRIQLYPNAQYSQRQLSGFYDNTDQDEILYGSAYRGLRDDNFRRAEFGNRINFELNNSKLLGETTVEGVQTTLESGPRSPLRGRRTLKLDATEGNTVAQNASDLFFGQGDILYQLSHSNLLPGETKVFINDEEISPNDYTLSNTTGILIFTYLGAELLDENDKIQVNYQYLLPDNEGEEFSGAELNFAQGDNLMEMFSGYNSDTLSGGRVAAEIRRGSDAGEFRLLPELALSQTSETGKGLAHNLDFYGRYGSWRFLGGNLQREKTFISLAPAVTEFGVLRKKTNAQFGYESASFNTYADYLTQSGEYGQETSYKAQGYFSQIKNLSLFSIANLRIADSDSLKRDYRELNFGGNYSLSDIILRRLRFRRLDLYGEAKTSVTDCEYPLGPDSANTKTNSNSIYLQGNISPGKNIHLTPECRLIDKTQSQNGEKPSPLSRDTMLRGTGNALDLIPGIRHYYHWNLEYNQDKFAFGNRDVYLYREGYLSNEFLPARWWDKLSVFNFGVTFYRSDKDSLLAVDEDFFDLWNIEEDYSFFSASNIYRVTYYPADEWEITEIITSSEGTASQRFQSQSTGWWRQEDSQICSRFYYTKDSDGINNSITYNPIIDWYRRWDKGFLTRFSLAVSFQDAETEDEYTVMPTVYVDKYLDIQIKNSYLQIRNTLQPEYRRSTGADNLDEFSLTEALNLDLNLYHKIIFRLIASADYTYDLETEAEETDFEIETRATIKF